ncbi:hypothetical protein VTN02DRAFT_449 [Thermoascus thermophilus]
MEPSNSNPPGIVFRHEVVIPDAARRGMVTIGTGQSSRVVRMGEWAVKLYKPTAVFHGLVERLVYERLGLHPYILRCFGASLEETVLGPDGALMLEYHPLGTLEENLEYLTLMPGWPLEATNAIGYIHSKGIIHCDIGCHNFLVTDTRNLVLADFGGSRFCGSFSYVRPRPRYTAPSFLENDTTDEPTVKDDLFALGTVLYEISSGRPLNRRFTDAQIRARFLARDFPAMDTDVFGLADVVGSCWREEYRNAEEVENDLAKTGASWRFPSPDIPLYRAFP